MFSGSLALDEKAIQIIDGYHNSPEIIFNGNQPFYLPNIDTVTMPVMPQNTKFYWLLFHELIHSTGAIYRLNRIIFQHFKERNVEEFNKLYCCEEMTAHLGSKMLLEYCGMFDDDLFVYDWIAYYQNRISVAEAKMAHNEAVNAFEFLIGRQNFSNSNKTQG